jgi:hypothetical protein
MEMSGGGTDLVVVGSSSEVRFNSVDGLRSESQNSTAQKRAFVSDSWEIFTERAFGHHQSSIWAEPFANVEMSGCLWECFMEVILTAEIRHTRDALRFAANNSGNVQRAPHGRHVF